MVITIICFIFASIMIIAIHFENEGNPNGISISIFQKIIGMLDYLLCRFTIISFLSFSANKEKSTPKKIEKIVWSRLCLVSALFIGYELLNKNDIFTSIYQIKNILCIYLALLQISMINSLLKPLFGIRREGKGLKLNQTLANNKTVIIPTPKRSLLLAFVNLFEIIITWGIIYRIIMPSISANEANYFSIVTITTLGYGDISGENSSLAQIAISFNMIIFVLFSICHITTILGTLTNKDND